MGIEAAILGAGILGAGSSIIGAKKGAKVVGQASDAATAEQRRQFDIAMGLSQPAIQSGNAAREQLMRLLGIAAPATPTTTVSAAAPLVERGGLAGLLSQGLSDHFRRQNGGGLPQRIMSAQGLDSDQPSRTGAPVSSTGAVSADPMDVIRNTPGFQFQTEQGTRALNAIRSAGGSSGGDLIRDFTRFNQGVASDFYRDYANRLANIAGTGQTASTQVGNQAIVTGSDIAGSLMSAGEARASGITGAAAGITGIGSELIKYLASLPAASVPYAGPPT